MKRYEVIASASGFALLTLVLTWPLAANPAHTLASDFGDPLFISWVMGWVAEHITRTLGGDLSALRTFWDANIFFPEPHTLAFSDHMVAETLQVLPIYWATGNLLLCYNVALMLSFALSGLGAYLLMRDLTGSAVAAAAAGVFFTFNEYRLSLEISHLQTLSVQWLPFALLGLHRYVAKGSRRALVCGGAALVALNLSAGFHMLYCAPFIAAFVLAELAWNGKLRTPRVWLDLGAAAAATIVLTLPFVLPYVAMQRQQGFERPLEEVIRFSATLEQYRAGLRGIAVPLLFSAVALGFALVHTVRERQRRVGVDPRLVAALAGAMVLAFWLSLGPVVQASPGHALGVPGAYGFLYDYVPGFHGLRAAGRFAMLFTFFLAMLAGTSVALLESLGSQSKRLAQAVTLVGCCVSIWQIRPVPFPLDRPWPFVSAGLNQTPAYLHPSPKLPAVYRWASRLDPGAVLVEFPFGDQAYEERYMFFAATRGWRMFGGYSGLFPASYRARRIVLEHPLERPDEAWAALAGATHAIVHERAWPDDTGERIARWLQEQGAREVWRFDEARVLQLPRIGHTP